LVRERVDEKSSTWRKVYFSGGAHFRNWLNQFQELWGEDDVEVDVYRIWVRESNWAGEFTQEGGKE
jgi:hypothetical protein